MNPLRKKRLLWLLAMLIGVATAVGLILFALRQNINLFYTPTEIATGKVPGGQVFRVGGMVRPGSVQRQSGNLTVQFVLTDYSHDVTVRYQGILPDLFAEGQGIIALGKMDGQQVFFAQQVLAKHDENYMPPEVKHALDRAAISRLKNVR